MDTYTLFYKRDYIQKKKGNHSSGKAQVIYTDHVLVGKLVRPYNLENMGYLNGFA